jgi:hypothetical protein
MGVPAMLELVEGLMQMIDSHLQSKDIDAEIVLLIAPVGVPRDYLAAHNCTTAKAHFLARQFMNAGVTMPQERDPRALPPKHTPTQQSTKQEVVEEETDFLAVAMERITDLFAEREMTMNCFAAIRYLVDGEVQIRATTTADKRDNAEMLSCFVYDRNTTS